MSPEIKRMIAGHAWLAAWILVLWAVAAPWRRLGGIESEISRWLEAAVLGTGAIGGFLVGLRVREGTRIAPGVRLALYPPAALAAATLVVLAWHGERGAIGVTTTAWLAYGAGFDLAFGALPLMEGKPLPVRPRTLSVAPETGSESSASGATQRNSAEPARKDTAPV